MLKKNALYKGHHRINTRMSRPNCIQCGKPAAVNYKRKTKIYYRKLCDSCVRSSKKPTSYRSLGYVKKKECDHCGFESKHPEHFLIYYLDGNKANQRISNLKTICLNCKVTIKNEGWRVTAGDLVPD